MAAVHTSPFTPRASLNFRVGDQRAFISIVMALLVLTATPLALVLPHGRPHGITHASHPATTAGGVVEIAPHTVTGRARARITMAADDAAKLRQEADRLALLAVV